MALALARPASAPPETPSSTPAPAPLLTVERLSLSRGEKLILDEVSFTLKRGATLGLVGESGAGKSTIALALIGLLQKPQVGLEGTMALDGSANLVDATEKDWLKLRGRRVSMIFQDASSALNPCFTVGSQLTSPLRRLLGMGAKEARGRAIDLLESVGLNDAASRLDAYPHQLSGGMQQRVMIAIALATNPELLLADEPTSALDVTIQAQIVRLILDETRKRGASCIFVLHDLALASQACDEIVVLYGGQVMEAGPSDVLLAEPLHPYTRGLKACVLELDTDELVPLPSGAPSFASKTPGCRFAPRCGNALPKCVDEKPPLETVRGRKLACWNPAA
ncbi:ABC transporter ATP-binding protein [Methylopila sp. Yamaguchi]|uniref:ABC transporter ATP-binding protein n=1 Tax=Methylopila sp. Yamaguchi TaxID=1437817 RepID=UPI000CBA6854|nr:ABC transporter ATP-binding protein [Methylopila sp. Yamaguchi]GBD47416.1 oligopeptide ABC transporter ATP-binding protein [Methylopila sp. Yamaguchi]